MQKRGHGSGHTQSPEVQPNSEYLLAHFDWVSFVQKLSFTHTFTSIFVSVETVQNPTRNGDPVLKREPGLRRARCKIATPRPRMGYCRGQSRTQIRVAGRGRKSTAIEVHNFLITGCAGTCRLLVATSALPL